jgi:hypothetical protein
VASATTDADFAVAAELPPIRKCRGADCGAQVRFLPVAHGTKTLIVNARSNLKGNVWAHRHGDQVVGQVLSGDAARAFRRAAIPLYLDHHSSCPNAKEFRRG